MFNNKVTRAAFTICALLLIAFTFHVHGFSDWWSAYTNQFDEGYIWWGDANAEDTCEASIYIDKWESDWFPWVNTYESASVSTAELNTNGEENVGSCSAWIRITAEDKGRVFYGADTIGNSKSKRRFFVSPGEVTVQARAQAYPNDDSDTQKVEGSF